MESLHQVPEAALNDWLTRAAATTTVEQLDALRNDAVTRARAQDAQAIRAWVDDHLDGYDEADPPALDIGDLLMLLTATQTWHLGNALGSTAEQLSQALGVVPELAPLARALDGEVRSLGRLKSLASGLRVVLDAPTARALLPLVTGWSTRAEATTRLEGVGVSWLRKLFGAHKALAAWTHDDAVWERWASISEAIAAVAERGGFLVWETEV